MNIVLATDENYTRFAATVIASLARTHPNIPLNIYILDSGMSEESRTRMQGMSGGQFCVRLFDVHRVQAFENHLNPRTELTTATFSRLLIPELLPDEQRALYLDSDVLVLRSLHELYYRDMGGKALCMVRDLDNDFHVRRLGVPHYFNAGVILYDLERCRQLHLTHRWMACLEDTVQPLLAMDQDVINIVSQREIGELPSLYNMQSNPSRQYNTEAIRSAWNNLVVLHLISPLRPWQPISHPFDMIYMQTMCATPWVSDALALRHRIRLHRLRCLFWCWRRYVTVSGGKMRTLRVLGIPLFSRYRSPTHRILYFLGIPLFVWHHPARESAPPQ